MACSQQGEELRVQPQSTPADISLTVWSHGDSAILWLLFWAYTLCAIGLVPVKFGNYWETLNSWPRTLKQLMKFYSFYRSLRTEAGSTGYWGLLSPDTLSCHICGVVLTLHCYKSTPLFCLFLDFQIWNRVHLPLLLASLICRCYMSAHPKFLYDNR